MKLIKIIMASLVTLSIIFLSFSCSSSTAATATTTTRTAVVIKGTLSNSITGTGNLAYSNSEDMAFEMAGYISEVLVSESDSVTKGQELVKLDTSDWEDQIKTLEKELTTAERNLATAQSTVAKDQRTVAEKTLAVKSAQLDLDNANYNLSTIDQVRIAQNNLDAAQRNLDTAKSLKAVGDGSVTSKDVQYYQSEVDSAQATLDELLKGASPTVTTSVALQITKYQLAVQSAQMNLEDAQTDVADAQITVSNAQEDLADAEQAVKDAQAKLDEEKALSPVITAPFDGFITNIKVKGGDEVFKGTVALTIADPNQYQADIMVTENDILNVKLGGTAEVSLDALSGSTYSAKITQIAPTATVSSGVVNYEVIVKLDSNSPVAAAPVAAVTDISLKEGLSATVQIILEQKTNVLYIPKKAVTNKGNTSTVQVVAGTTTETRTVQTGMNDGTNIEITSGLSEGEKVVYSSSSSSSNSNSNQGGMPGMGGPPGGF